MKLSNGCASLEKWLILWGLWVVYGGAVCGGWFFDTPVAPHLMRGPAILSRNQLG
jgi:hypothetical protein